jgi:hypothetical protein
LYGELATGCGYPIPVIDAMTMAEAELIFAAWREAPPAHHMLQVLARLWGWQGPAAGRVETPPAPTIADLAGMPGFSRRRDVHEGLPAPILDFETLKARHAR